MYTERCGQGSDNWCGAHTQTSHRGRCKLCLVYTKLGGTETRGPRRGRVVQFSWTGYISSQKDISPLLAGWFKRNTQTRYNFLTDDPMRFFVIPWGPSWCKIVRK